MKNDRAAVRAKTHRHPMRVVTRRTGLSPELLRVWERRYRVVTPARTQTGRRLYSDAEIERLHLLYRATLSGRSIGSVAGVTTPALIELLRQDAEAELTRAVDGNGGRGALYDSTICAGFVAECLRAVEAFDPSALGAALHRASVALPATTFLETVVGSLLEQVGARWRDGTLRPVHGHLTASMVRRVLEATTVAAPALAPKILFATVTGEVHELGAMIAASAAASEGWSVTWLGANLPADDIADAATRLRVRAVGLSLVHPAGDAAISTELRRLRSLLPRSVALIVGGAALPGYAAVLDAIDAIRITDLNSLVIRLREMTPRSPRRRSRATRP